MVSVLKVWTEGTAGAAGAACSIPLVRALEVLESANQDL
jgi:hypothetical protein